MGLSKSKESYDVSTIQTKIESESAFGSIRSSGRSQYLAQVKDDKNKIKDIDVLNRNETDLSKIITDTLCMPPKKHSITPENAGAVNRGSTNDVTVCKKDVSVNVSNITPPPSPEEAKSGDYSVRKQSSPGFSNGNVQTNSEVVAEPVGPVSEVIQQFERRISRGESLKEDYNRYLEKHRRKSESETCNASETQTSSAGREDGDTQGAEQGPSVTSEDKHDGADKRTDDSSISAAPKTEQEPSATSDDKITDDSSAPAAPEAGNLPEANETTSQAVEEFCSNLQDIDKNRAEFVQEMLSESNNKEETPSGVRITENPQVEIIAKKDSSSSVEPVWSDDDPLGPLHIPPAKHLPRNSLEINYAKELLNSQKEEAKEQTLEENDRDRKESTTSKPECSLVENIKTEARFNPDESIPTNGDVFKATHIPRKSFEADDKAVTLIASNNLRTDSEARYSSQETCHPCKQPDGSKVSDSATNDTKPEGTEDLLKCTRMPPAKHIPRKSLEANDIVVTTEISEVSGNGNIEETWHSVEETRNGQIETCASKVESTKSDDPEELLKVAHLPPPKHIPRKSFELQNIKVNTGRDDDDCEQETQDKTQTQKEHHNSSKIDVDTTGLIEEQTEVCKKPASGVETQNEVFSISKGASTGLEDLWEPAHMPPPKRLSKGAIGSNELPIDGSTDILTNGSFPIRKASIVVSDIQEVIERTNYQRDFVQQEQENPISIIGQIVANSETDTQNEERKKVKDEEQEKLEDAASPVTIIDSCFSGIEEIANKDPSVHETRKERTTKNDSKQQSIEENTASGALSEIQEIMNQDFDKIKPAEGPNLISKTHIELPAANTVQTEEESFNKPDEKSVSSPTSSETKGDSHLPLSTIQEIIHDAEKLRKDVEEFEGPKNDVHYVYLNEMLLRCLLKLDGINVGCNEDLRQQRKNATEYVQECIKELDNRTKGKEPDIEIVF